MMSFTKIGRIVAFGAITLGLLRILTAIIALLSDDPATATRSLLGSHKTGFYFDQGTYSVLFGIALGILTDISRSLSSKT